MLRKYILRIKNATKRAVNPNYENHDEYDNKYNETLKNWEDIAKKLGY